MDGLSREELLREVQRMYPALVPANCVLRQGAMEQPHSPYWADPRGTGGRRRGRGLLALEWSSAATYPEGKVSRGFFRYAADLLFTLELGFGWWVCEKCGTMSGSDPQRNPQWRGERMRREYEFPKDMTSGTSTPTSARTACARRTAELWATSSTPRTGRSWTPGSYSAVRVVRAQVGDR